MVTPLPTPDRVDLEPPSATEARRTAHAIAAAVAPSEGLTGTQRVLLEALFDAMTGHAVDLSTVEVAPGSAAEALGEVLAERNEAFRTRGPQVMLLGALVLRPLPTDVAERVESCARLGPPLLAQHDWVHVLADYGTTVESELEVFALIARANDDMKAFSLLAMVVSLFETGHLDRGAGLFEAAPGHLSAGEEMGVRVADAMRRGALCHDRERDDPSVDFMSLDWFALAAEDLHDVRARFALEGKSERALAAGSVGPWERGGISEYQLAAGRAAAAAARVDYDSFGASVG